MKDYPEFNSALYQERANDALKYAKQKGMDAAEVTITEDKGFTVSARSGDVETLEHHQSKYFVITVYHNQRTAHASTGDLSIQAIEQTVEKACSIASFVGVDEFVGLADPSRLAFHYPELELYHPWDIDPTRAIEMAIECETIARSQDKRIKESEGATVQTINYFKVYANSDDFVGAYPLSDHMISCSVVAEENGDMQRDYEYTVSRKPENLDDITFVAKHAAEKTLRRLNAQKLTTRKCPVIFYAPAAKTLLSAFINAISGGPQYRDTTFLKGYLGKQIFPATMHIHQQPHLLAGLGSAPFDSEGVKTEDRDFIKDGILMSYVLGSYSARKLGMQSTGNSGGVFNLTVNHSDDNLMKLFQRMGTGLFVTELMGQGTNLLTGDYSRGAAGYWIENGEIQYPVEEITIAGNLKDMFANLVAVGNDIDTRGRIHVGSILLEKMTVAGH